MFETALAAFLGALGALVVSMYVEYQRKPKLHITIEEPVVENTYSGAPATKATFLRVQLRNKPMGRLLKWLGRDAAMHCNGHVQFHHLDNGDPIFSKPMPVRWAGSDEPLSVQVLSTGQVAQLLDPTKYSAAFTRNCYPGGVEPIDVVARFDLDPECYGWSNETYLPGKGWRNKDWELPPGTYLVKVTIFSAGEPASDIFKLDNTVPRPQFRLAQATEEEKKRPH